jgi:hypothetical protein
MVAELLPGLWTFACAGPLAILIALATDAAPGKPETGLLLSGTLLAAVLVVVPAADAVLHRPGNTARSCLVAAATVGVVLCACYLYVVSYYVRFPADILLWSESDFVNDILKFTVGYPLYSPQANNDSFTYMPGAQLLTYFLALPFAQLPSIPVYRAIQLGYTFLAAIVASICCRRLLMLSGHGPSSAKWWSAIWVPAFFLMASNSLTNPFVHALHDDALAQLVTVMAYWLVVEYVATRSKIVLGCMACVPAIGLFVKQSLLIWSLLYGVQVGLYDQPRSARRLAWLAGGMLVGIVGVAAACYIAWGNDFVYWTITVLGRHAVSPVRSVLHVLDAWAYAAAGLVGGLVLLRDRRGARLRAAFVVWVLLFLVEGYTSGIAPIPQRNHLGPACLIAGIWFGAAMVALWPTLVRSLSRFTGRIWPRVALVMVLVGLCFNGLGAVRPPLKPFSADAYRYIAEIEREFDGLPATDVLLDFGTWLYRRDGVIMQDRAPTIGERGYSQTGDFSAIIQRLDQKRYAKILVRNLHSADFWYEDSTWPVPGGIRSALLRNYHEVGTIAAVRGDYASWTPPYELGTISILVPNTR